MADHLRPISLDQLKEAVRGSAAAVRLRLRLQPAGGKGTKVFPPTYQGGIYAVEKRIIDGKEISCVLLDSVQSQANRLEQSLLQAFRGDRLKFPLLAVDFSKYFPDIGEITTLDAPHRIADAIFRDSTLNGKAFRPQPKAGGKRDTAAISDEGKRFAEANIRNATPLFELCPTALIFGVWDSTGAAGGSGNKFARAIVSEIVGVNAVAGKRASSRLDPLAIEKGEVYEGTDGSWVVLESEAKKETTKVKENGKEVEKQVPVLFKRKIADKGKPSELNHGNVTPDIVTHESEMDPESRRITKKGNDTITTFAPLAVGGGVTMDYAEQVTVLSLSALRRLQFPVDGKTSLEANHAARVALAALALAAVAHQMNPPDYFLRSNCQLVLETDPVFEFVRTAADVTSFTLTASQADELFGDAIKEAKNHQLPWREGRISLEPKKALVDLVRRSRELGGDGEA
jgi:CRISPR-associated protein Csb1